MMPKAWRLNTITVGTTIVLGVTSLAGLVTAPTMLYEIDDWLVIGICIAMSLWYATGNNRWQNSLVPAYLLTILSVITFVAFIGEAGTLSVGDEMIAFPILLGLTVVEYVMYFETEKSACSQPE